MTSSLGMIGNLIFNTLEQITIMYAGMNLSWQSQHHCLVVDEETASCSSTLEQTPQNCSV